MDAIIRAVGHRKCHWIAALELIVELLPSLVVHLTVADALGVLIKFFHRPIGLRQRGNAANSLRLLQPLIPLAIGFEAREVFVFLPRQFAVLKTDRTKHRLHPVKILGGNRIKFVIVTLGASQFVGEKSDADRVDHIIQILLPRHRRHAHRRVLPRPHPQEAGGNHVIGIIRLQFIAGNLLAHKLVVRLVGIEGAHHVISIAPRVRSRVVIGKARRIRIAHHVQPMPRHLLAVMRTGQQPIDQRRPSGIRILLPRRRKLECLLRGRRQAGEVVCHTPNQRHRAGAFCHSQSLRQTRINKRIYRVPVRRHRRFFHGLIRPQFLRIILAIRPTIIQSATGFHQDTIGLAPWIGILENGSDSLGIRPRRAGGNPLFHITDLFGTEFVISLGRHGGPIVFMFAGYRQKQRTGQRLARHEHGFLTLAPRQQAGARAHIQFALEFLRIIPVAGQALDLE